MQGSEIVLSFERRYTHATATRQRSHGNVKLSQLLLGLRLSLWLSANQKTRLQQVAMQQASSNGFGFYRQNIGKHPSWYGSKHEGWILFIQSQLRRLLTKETLSANFLDF